MIIALTCTVTVATGGTCSLAVFKFAFVVFFLFVLFFFVLETKAKLLAERDRASAETAFKALDTDENGR